MTLRVLLADDHKMMRDGLRTLIDGEADMHVVGEADNGRTAVERAVQLRPHVVVMDIGMPDLNGVDPGVIENVRVEWNQDAPVLGGLDRRQAIYAPEEMLLGVRPVGLPGLTATAPGCEAV